MFWEGLIFLGWLSLEKGKYKNNLGQDIER